ncbi:MAG: hypothetical protein LBT55_03910 [Clostridiaceae bacterium]|nr:hypothetical protein [Clostridiaceae bacterium]
MNNFVYDYFDLLKDTDRLKSIGCSGNIGRTALGLPIPSLTVGRGIPRALIFGAVHAREWLTAALVIKLAEEYAGEEAILFVPMVNIDGVQLSLYGLDAEYGDAAADAEFKRRKEYLLEINGGSRDFSLWKANIRGTDINVNFPMDWGNGASNRNRPSSESYIGTEASSEPETKALLRAAGGIRAAVSYHTKGEVIYHGYGERLQTEQALPFSGVTGYPLAESKGSAGGFKDWFVGTGLGFALTIEVGSDALPHPLDLRELEGVYRQNGNIPALIAKAAHNV